jgi:mitochondrial fusion and transport protein UGO1
MQICVSAAAQSWFLGVITNQAPNFPFVLEATVLMAAPREGPNPLRPYYIPPSIGIASENLLNSSSSIPKQSGGGTPSSSFSLGDLDYTDYLPDSSPSISGSVKDLIDKTVWKYASVLMAQPFEVAKLILQVHVAQDEHVPGPLPETERRYEHEDEESVDSSDDEPNFFTSNTPPGRESSFSPARGRSGRPRQANGRKYQHSPPEKPTSAHRLTIKNPHSLVDALSSLSSHSGALSLWRATNTTFIYTILHRTFETFFKSFLAAILGIAEADISSPSPAGVLPTIAILTSTAPLASVLITTASSTLSSLLLSPIDTARTRLILTPASVSPRSLLATIKTLPSPSYLTPPHLIPITFFTSTIPAFISSSTPLILKNYLNIDPVLNPNSWSVATFALSAMELVIKWPFETVLRRAQIATWTAPPRTPPVPSSSRKVVETIVPVPQSYRGIIPTMWAIMKEEGTSVSKTEKAAAAIARHPRHVRKGQGIEGLYRGWRVGMWGLVGVWGASFIGGMQSGIEATAEGIPVHGKKF